MSTAAHTDMLLMNLIRMNGLSPKRSKHNPKRNWCSGTSSSEARPASSTPRHSAHARRSRHHHQLSPGQLPRCNRTHTGHVGSFSATPPETAEQAALSSLNMALHEYWPSVSDNDEMNQVDDDARGSRARANSRSRSSGATRSSTDFGDQRAEHGRSRVQHPMDYLELLDSFDPPVDLIRSQMRIESLSEGISDTLFDMLLNSLTLEGPASECGDEGCVRPPTPPVQPWSPATAPGGAPSARPDAADVD